MAQYGAYLNRHVVIPCFGVREQILGVIQRIDSSVSTIWVIDDKCPEGTGDFVEAQCKDPRVKVRRHSKNQGVGGAVKTGYQLAATAGADVVVKLDGDGQMDPRLIAKFCSPIENGRFDYTKGNRFHDLEGLRAMPLTRLLGNAGLSFLAKISTGYWNIFDPTNGYTAISGSLLRQLPYQKISNRYFFETDMLFRLYLLRAKVQDVPMRAVYGEEKSSLRPLAVLPEFAIKHLRNFLKRVFYCYYLRDVSLGSFLLPVGIAALLFGVIFGAYQWSLAVAENRAATSGTVMLAGLPVILGLQFIMGFLSIDLGAVPQQPVSELLEDRE